MAQIDLSPKAVREIDPKTGRDKRDMSPRWYRNWFLIGLVMLTYIFFVRDEITSPTALFGATAIIAVCSGMALFGWIRDIY